MNQAHYSSIRDSIKSGDIVAVRNDSFASKLIRVFTQEPYSHVAVAWRDGRHVMLIEASSKTGIRIRPLSSAFQPGQVLRLISIAKDYWTDEIEDYALKQWGSPYSYIHCILAGFGVPLTQDGKWQCAEFCSKILELGGINTVCRFMTPGDLVESLLLKDCRITELTQI